MGTITQVFFRNWKSYDDATLYVDPLSVLIGTNAGGKSNALDALIFLNRIASGSMLTSALQGDGVQTAIRGGVEWAARHPLNDFSLGVVVRADESSDYRYQIKCQVSENRCEIESEDLVRIKYRQKKDSTRGAVSGEIKLFRTDHVQKEQPHIVARLYNEKQGAPRQLGRSTAIIFQLVGQKYRQEIQDGVEDVVRALRGIFILDPIPSHMRGFSQLSERLEADAGNIAGVIAALPDSSKKEFENSIRRYIKQLPEKEISRVYAERVGKFQSDAMLYCEENFVDGKNGAPIVDARGMSDGTLRFLGILTALLTRPEGTLLVIEEVDNGLHPSRSHLLLSMLMEIGRQRGVDVLVTTHNPALLDEMGTKMVPFITVVHRDPTSGASKLTLLEDIRWLPKMLSVGTVGKLSTKGVIEKALRGDNPQLSLSFE